MTNEAADSAPRSDDRGRGDDRDRGGRRDRGGDRGERGDRGDRGDRGGGRGGFRRRGCEFCRTGQPLDYKDLDTLRRYLTDRGRIESRRRTGCNAKCQRMLAQAVKRARFMALLPYTQEHVRVSGVPAGRMGGGRR